MCLVALTILGPRFFLPIYSKAEVELLVAPRGVNEPRLVGGVVVVPQRKGVVFFMAQGQMRCRAPVDWTWIGWGWGNDNGKTK